MKKILYRGKVKRTGEWVEGYYAKAKDYLSEKEIHVIFPVDLTLYPHSEFSSYEEIVPETLGRLIDQPCYDCDHIDQKIFQGDIVGVYSRLYRYEDIPNLKPDHLAVVVDDNCITENGLGRWFPQDTTRVRVVGNVYDTPELIGAEYANLYKYYHCLED